MGEAVAIGVLVVLFFVYVLLMGFLIANYILQSLALHTLARRRGIANPWLAWIPYGDYWIIGSLARDHDKQQGCDRRWDKVLLVLSIVGIASFLVVYIALFVFVIINAINMEAAGITYGEDIAVEMLGGLVVFYVLLIAVIVVMAALQALTYVCVYKIFESTVAEKALKYFLIYLLVPFAAPICLFLCRNKGYQHPDPMAYIYNPVNKNYSYYQTNVANPVVETTESQIAETQEPPTEEPTNTEE